ncbi:TPA: HIT family protein [Photobacterium damselae]|nr:HIT family protein [Photobacterium damselae]MCG3845053.1 HIT family protein [Photobacterium damselae]MCG9778293.1 HIT family protein [Photobacterium damselae]NVH47975.1 HIT family protein [Photobacterium damselae subsp. damselae]UJZ96307.1 HIT family protein [Photobacterium damselae subsp. damselae]UJZ99789.1 HIT family protein [Photobacterium damselae subsp. damselae]
MACVFCEIVKGKLPCHKVWEDDKHLAFLSIYPNTKGFTVVIPKKHCSSYAFAQSDEVLCDLIVATKKVALLLDKSFDGVARTGMFFEGYGVDHLHSKLSPMHGTGNNSEFQLIEANIDKFYDNYEGYLSSHDWHRADDSELAQIAAHIRSVDAKE